MADWGASEIEVCGYERSGTSFVLYGTAVNVEVAVQVIGWVTMCSLPFKGTGTVNAQVIHRYQKIFTESGWNYAGAVGQKYVGASWNAIKHPWDTITGQTSALKDHTLPSEDLIAKVGTSVDATIHHINTKQCRYPDRTPLRETVEELEETQRVIAEATKEVNTFIASFEGGMDNLITFTE